MFPQQSSLRSWSCKNWGGCVLSLGYEGGRSRQVGRNEFLLHVKGDGWLKLEFISPESLKGKVRRFQGLTMTMECFVRSGYKDNQRPIASILKSCTAKQSFVEHGKGSGRVENELERTSPAVH